MSFKVNQIVSYRDLCNEEDQEQLQRGMNFELRTGYSVEIGRAHV